MVWDYNKTTLIVQFDELPLNEDIPIRLTNWYEELQQNFNCRNSIKLSGKTLSTLTLIDKTQIQPNTAIILSLWDGIYPKWESAVKSPNISSNDDVVILIHKRSKRAWKIKSIEIVK